VRHSRDSQRVGKTVPVCEIDQIFQVRQQGCDISLQNLEPARQLLGMAKAGRLAQLSRERDRLLARALRLIRVAAQPKGQSFERQATDAWIMPAKARSMASMSIRIVDRESELHVLERIRQPAAPEQ
jgi:hypothetical protein